MWHRQLTVTRLDPNAGAYRYSHWPRMDYRFGGGVGLFHPGAE